MSKKYKVIALIGKSASGKDTLLNLVCERSIGLHRKISTTTREPRDYEVEGKDYFFTSPTDFAQKIIDGEMLEATSFNDWFYGTEKKAFQKDKINIGVFNPEGVMALSESKEVDLTVIYVLCPDKIRWIRSLQREEKPNIDEIYRRFKADKIDFSDLDFPFSVVINDGKQTVDELAEQIKKIIVDNAVKKA